VFTHLVRNSAFLLKGNNLTVFDYPVEFHRYEASGVGKKEFKIKGFVD
jgi:hypothetical protein